MLRVFRRDPARGGPWRFPARFLLPLLFLSSPLAPSLLAGPDLGSTPSDGVADPQGRLEYAFELLSTAPARVAVHVRFEPEAPIEDPAFFLPESWASAEGLARSVANATDTTDGGERAVAEDPPNTWRLTSLRAAGDPPTANSPAGPLSLRYELTCDQERIGSESSSYYHVLLFDDLFHATGSAALVVPRGADFDRERSIQVSFRGFEEAGWEVVSSFGTGEGPFERTMPLTAFYSSIFFAGKLRVLEREVEGGTLVCALARSEWNFTDEEFADLAATVLDSERRFFELDSPPRYLITAIPVGERPRSSLGGTGLTDSFATFLSPGWSLAPGSEDRLRIEILLAHELFHHWNGHTIRLAQPEAEGYWFSEGFTDYFCRRLLWQEGELTDAQYRAEIDELFRRFHQNPARAAANSEIAAKFFADRSLGDLPYQRGQLLAFWLEEAIQRHSNETLGLDTWMQDLCLECSESGEALSCEDLLERLGAVLDPKDAATLRRVVQDGETPPIPASAYAALGPLETFALESFELGFDGDRSFAEKRVIGLQPGSAAQAAGLAEGTVLKSWSVNWGRPERNVVLEIAGDGGPRRVEYRPVAAGTVECPRFRQ